MDSPARLSYLLQGRLHNGMLRQPREYKGNARATNRPFGLKVLNLDAGVMFFGDFFIVV